MEEEVITPPRGGLPAPEPQGARAVPFPDDFPEVSRIQKDMAILREEIRLCVNQIRIRRIRHTTSAMQTVIRRQQGWQWSPDRDQGRIKWRTC